jgi:hypothetical protein
LMGPMKDKVMTMATLLSCVSDVAGKSTLRTSQTILYQSPHDLPLHLWLLQVAHLAVSFVSGVMDMLADIGSPRIKCNDRPRQQYCDIRCLRKVSGERVPTFSLLQTVTKTRILKQWKKISLQKEALAYSGNSASQ